MFTIGQWQVPRRFVVAKLTWKAFLFLRAEVKGIYSVDFESLPVMRHSNSNDYLRRVLGSSILINNTH